jgi:hypothetical protein
VPGDPVYVFSVSDGAGDVGQGVLHAIDDGLGDGGMLAVSGSLTMTGGSLAGNTFALLTAGPAVTLSPTGNFIVDNLVYPGNNAANGVNNGQGGLGAIANPSFLDNGGLLFGQSGFDLNIWGNGANDYAIDWTGGGVTSGAKFKMSLATPEPASLTLLGIGAVGLAGTWWRKRRTLLNLA